MKLEVIITATLFLSLHARTDDTFDFDDDTFDGDTGTGCCPQDPAFEKALQHPNATGSFSFAGLHLDNKTRNIPMANWTWSTTVMEVPLSDGNFSTNQIYTLDVPLDVDIYSWNMQRNVCTVLLSRKTQNHDDPGDCTKIFSESEIDRLKDSLTGAVGMTITNGSSPCVMLGGLSQGN